jgi:uncharacterized membrane protein
MRDNLQRIYKIKVTILALVAAVVGVALLAVARLVSDLPASSWVHFVPIGELGGRLFISGVFVVAYLLHQREGSGRTRDCPPAASAQRERA